MIEQLLFCGSAAQVADRLTPFVEHGLSHVVVINWAARIGPDVALNSYREQFKLNRLLKRMTPGTKAWALPTPQRSEEAHTGAEFSAPELAGRALPPAGRP